MSSILYVWRCSFLNMMKKNIRRPVFWIYAAFLTGYGLLAARGIYEFIAENSLRYPEILAVIVSAFLLYLTPAGYSAYARRKGMLFRNCDVHFMFSSPVSPKLFLLCGQIKTLAAGFLMELIVTVLGVLWFKVSVPKMLLYFLLISILGTVMESSLVICLYGNERLKEKTLKKIGYLLYGIIALLLVLGVVYLQINGFQFSTAAAYLSGAGIQMIPLIGWEIAAVRLILVGPDAVNTAGTILYLLAVVLLFTAAVRMKCTGQYYEDAMKFADDYEQMIAQKKKDGTSGLRRNRKLRRVRSSWNGSGAAAILSRQLLEYKKEKFFIFSIGTLVYLAVDLVLIYMDRAGKLGTAHEFGQYLLLGISAYLMLIFGSLPIKWMKELDNPYVFLIPDNPVKKIWYATCLEHIKSAVNMMLLVIPAGLVFGVEPLILILTVWIGTVAGAVRIYSDTITKAILGNVLGNTGRSLLQMLIAWTFIGFSIPFFLFSLYMFGETAAFFTAGIYLTAAAFVLMLGGSHAFTRMELTE